MSEERTTLQRLLDPQCAQDYELRVTFDALFINDAGFPIKVTSELLNDVLAINQRIKVPVQASKYLKGDYECH